MTSSGRESALLLRLAMAVIGFALLFVLFLPTGGHPPEIGRRTQCERNMKQIGTALRNYHYEYGCFPPAYFADETGKPMHSWRVLLLPFIEQEKLYQQYRFDEPWNGPHNRKLADQFVPAYFGPAYHCPSEIAVPEVNTSYVVVVGPNTMFPGSEFTRFSDITDGLPDPNLAVDLSKGWNKTILFVEIAHSGIHWMEPRDLAFEDAIKGVNRKDGPSISSEHKWGAQVVFDDGDVGFVSDKISQETLRQLLERNDGELIRDY